MIETCTAAGVPPVLLSIHSFTDSWKGEPRPWDAAILWDRDHRFAVPMLEALRAERGVVVGENEPYDGKLAGDCMWQHGTRRGLAHTIIEVRQDLIRTPEGQKAWAQRIANARESDSRPRRSARRAAQRALFRLAHGCRGGAPVHGARGQERLTTSTFAENRDIEGLCGGIRKNPLDRSGVRLEARPTAPLASITSSITAGRRGMTTLQASAQKQLRQLVEQIERLEEEKKALAGDLRDKFLEAKAMGFDVKVLRQIVRLRKKSETERDGGGRHPRGLHARARHACRRSRRLDDRRRVTWAEHRLAARWK